MKLLKKYLLLNYSQTFFPIFLTLYTITSIIFLVKIASLTSVIQIDFVELLQLYSFSVPVILYYTLPLSIFVSISLAFSKLSSEYELIVITSFGLNPLRVIRFIAPTLLLSTLLLFIVSVVLIPKAEYLRDTFISEKKVEAQFNIKASEYGQQFGEWLIYVNKEKNGVYEDIVLYKNDKKLDNFIVAKSATMENKNLSLSLKLKNGKAIDISNKITQINFKDMVINNKIKPPSNINNLDDLLLYWSDIPINRSKEAMFTYYILNSMLPILLIFFIISIGYFNPRYDKNRTTVISLGVSILYIILAKKSSQILGLDALLYIPAIWLILGYSYYYYKIRSHY